MQNFYSRIDRHQNDSQNANVSQQILSLRAQKKKSLFCAWAKNATHAALYLTIEIDYKTLDWALWEKRETNRGFIMGANNAL
jgi:hypothetical protein